MKRNLVMFAARGAASVLGIAFAVVMFADSVSAAALKSWFGRVRK